MFTVTVFIPPITYILTHQYTPWGGLSIAREIIINDIRKVDDTRPIVIRTPKDRTIGAD
jgi:hypothetical protein